MVVKNDFWAIVIFLIIVLILAIVLGGLLSERHNSAEGEESDPPPEPLVEIGPQETPEPHALEQASDLFDRVEALASSLGGLEDNLALLQDAITTNGQWQDDIGSRVGSVERDITSLHGGVQSIDAHLKNLETALIWSGMVIAALIVTLLIWVIISSRQIRLLRNELAHQRSRLARIVNRQRNVQPSPLEKRKEENRLSWMVAEKVE